MGGGKPFAAARTLLHPCRRLPRRPEGISGDFPAYFEPALPRGNAEGAFWYHHIQNHPDFAEMARKNVRYMWSSFWFTGLVDMCPTRRSGNPTLTRAGGSSAKDERREDQCVPPRMREHGIGVYAYFNVTEYGGAGGARRCGEAARLLRERFADALVKDERDRDIPTWEGAMAMNPRRGLSLWPVSRRRCGGTSAVARNRRFHHRPSRLGQPVTITATTTE